MASSADTPGQVSLFASYVTVTKAPSISKLHCLPLTSPGYTVGSPPFKPAGRGIYHRRSYLGGFYGRIFIGLEVVYITSTYILPVTIQSYDQMELQGRLGNVFEQLF